MRRIILFRLAAGTPERRACWHVWLLYFCVLRKSRGQNRKSIEKAVNKSCVHVKRGVTQADVVSPRRMACCTDHGRVRAVCHRRACVCAVLAGAGEREDDVSIDRGACDDVDLVSCTLTLSRAPAINVIITKCLSLWPPFPHDFHEVRSVRLAQMPRACDTVRRVTPASCSASSWCRAYGCVRRRGGGRHGHRRRHTKNTDTGADTPKTQLTHSKLPTQTQT